MMHEESWGAGKFVCGMTTGLLAGAVLGMTMAPSRREMRRCAHKAAKHVIQAVDNFTDAIGM